MTIKWTVKDIVEILRDMAEIEREAGDDGSTGYEALNRAAGAFEDEGATILYRFNKGCNRCS